MFMISCFVIILLPVSCYGVECFAKASFYLTLSTRTLNMIERILEYQDIVHRPFCAAVLRLDFAGNELMLRLDQTNLKWDLFETRYIHIYAVSIFSFHSPEYKRKPSVSTAVTFRCSDVDHCDRPLILEYIQLLITGNNDNFVNAIHPLFPFHSETKSKTNP